MHLGFLAVVHDPQGYQGGLLVTNGWGRPLEFRLTTPLQPTRVHQILYGATLRPHLFADVLGKALLDKAATPLSLILVNAAELLELRRHTAWPVGWVQSTAPTPEAQGPAADGPERFSVEVHAAFPDDRHALARHLESLAGSDLLEPFDRIREALTEARKRTAA
ncbi:MAG TPA: hypothetical protein PKD86_12990 [Gemmatales bacterium]|nr:hypothetical protein [Gemmatales bacterium]HMP60258.1 hypothetical protein [Gemmatales bacterium]